MKTFKVIGLLALVFVAGFAGGVVATRMMVRRALGEKSRLTWIANYVWIRSSGNGCTRF